MGKLNPQLYDLGMKPLERSQFHRIRESIAGKAEGRVLEIGSGTGANFPFYERANTVHAIEPDPDMRKRSLLRAEKAKVHIKTYGAKAEQLPFAADTFDAVVATLVFCTILEPAKALQELRRVSKPGAHLAFFEHVRMKKAPFGKLQDALTPIWAKASAGCHLNRETLKAVKKSGLMVTNVTEYYNGLFLVIECLNEK